MAAANSIFGGEQLVRNSGAKETIAPEKYVGIYFSAHWCPPCRAFTPQLVGTYNKLVGAGKPFEIVFVSSDKDEPSFNEYFHSMPWLAVPFGSRELINSLKKKFKVEGIPTLVLLAPDGSVVTAEGRSAVGNDPEGTAFPWAPKPVSAQLNGGLLGQGGATVDDSAIAGKPIGLYFSAHWCPPCRAFTPELTKTYNKMKAAGKQFDIVFVSSDGSKEEFDEYFGSMPWLALPFKDPRIQSISSALKVQSLPTLVILAEDHNTVITRQGRTAANEDPEGADFPWHPKPVNSLEASAGSLNDTQTVVAFLEEERGVDEELRTSVCAALEAVARRHIDACKADGSDPMTFCWVKKDGGLGSRIREIMDLGDSYGATLVLMDIPDEGGYYVSPATGSEINEDAIQAFLDMYKAEGLERRQLKGGE